VDEPELHLHRAIQARLWDAIEAARPDCTFVYITHDLEFAASRSLANKVWLRDYTNGTWEWDEVPNSDALPEPLLLEVMGSRRPILFVEGDQSSLDLLICGKAFPGYTVVPCGSCELVIHSTCSFEKMKPLHDKKCAGLVDNDGRSESDIQRLNQQGIAVLPVALIENLFLIEPVLALAAKKLGHAADEIVGRVKEQVFDALARNRVKVVSNLTRMEIETELRRFGGGPDGIEALTAAYTDAATEIDPSAIYTDRDSEVDRVLREKDYRAALRYYKVKGLASHAADSVFRMPFRDQVLRWLRGNDSAELVKALQTALPTIPSAT
jgi:hypothetical protein